MLHKGCGGQIVQDWGKTHIYDSQLFHTLRCGECGMEIRGDVDIELTEEEV